MALAFSELRSETRSNIRRDSSAFSDTRLDYCLNWAQRMIANEPADEKEVWEEMKKRLYNPVLEDCEAAWTANTNVTCTADTDIVQRGSASAKQVVAAAFSTGVAAYKNFSTAVDMSDYTHLRFDIYSDIATDEGDLQLLLDNTAGCGSALETLNVSALTAETWSTETLEFSSPSALTAILAVGLNIATDNGAQTVYLDDIRYVRSTEKDVKDYSYPTRMRDIIDISLESGSESRQLEYVHERYFDEVVPRPREDTSDKPRYYVDYGDHFELWPIPDAVYPLHIRFTQFPADLSADTDTSALEDKDHLIIALATAMALDEIMEDEMAERWQKIYAMRLTNARKGNNTSEDWRPIAKGFNSYDSGSAVTQYWKDPFHGRGFRGGYR